MAVIDRAQWLADARALLDLIEANPEIPLPPFRGLEISHHPSTLSTEDNRRAKLDRIAAVLGAEVTGEDGRYQTTVSMGSAQYRAVVHTDASQHEWQEQLRLGAEALAELRKCDQARAEVEAVASR